MPVLGNRKKFRTLGYAITLILVSLWLPELAAQQSPLERRLSDVCRLLSPLPPIADSIFAADFMNKVSPMQLQAGLALLMKKAGSCVSIWVSSRVSEFSAKVEAVSDSGYIYPITLTVQSVPPHKIEGLFISTPVRQQSSLDSVMGDLSKLPGKTSICITNLTKNVVLAAKDTSAYLPIGSTFKLYVLGELVRSIVVNKHRWNEVISLDSNRYSLPSGVMQTWPHGSPVTLHTLASTMISMSDNTATDHLLLFLGRKQVEGIQKVMGHSRPELNSPFLTTRDMFLLKFTNDGAAAHHYAKLDQKNRLEFLRSYTSSTSPDTVEYVSTPILPDTVEWFATTPDLCRAMDWLRKTSSKSAAAPLMGILAINPGLDLDTKTWKTICYKGGSEAGVLNMTYLLQHTNGTWYALSCSWMRTDSDVDLSEFSGIVAQAVRVIGQQNNH